MKTEPVHYTTHHKTFDEAVEKGMIMEDKSKGYNTFILLSPKTENDKLSRAIIGSTKGIIRRSNTNDWVLIWTYGK